jgi:hypothetical protein
LEDVKGLLSLWLEAVVDVDDENGNVGQRPAARAQCRKRVMAGRVDEQQTGQVEVVWIDEVAPMCWVMAPASLSLTAEPRTVSNRLVFPWSTWPSTATMGVRSESGAGRSAVSDSVSDMGEHAREGLPDRVDGGS